MRKKTNFEGEQTVGEFLLLPFVAPAAQDLLLQLLQLMSKNIFPDNFVPISFIFMLFLQFLAPAAGALHFTAAMSKNNTEYEKILLISILSQLLHNHQDQLYFSKVKSKKIFHRETKIATRCCWSNIKSPNQESRFILRIR